MRTIIAISASAVGVLIGILLLPPVPGLGLAILALALSACTAGAALGASINEKGKTTVFGAVGAFLVGLALLLFSLGREPNLANSIQILSLIVAACASFGLAMGAVTSNVLHKLEGSSGKSEGFAILKSHNFIALVCGFVAAVFMYVFLGNLDRLPSDFFISSSASLPHVYQILGSIGAGLTALVLVALLNPEFLFRQVVAIALLFFGAQHVFSVSGEWSFAGVSIALNTKPDTPGLAIVKTICWTIIICAALLFAYNLIKRKRD